MLCVISPAKRLNETPVDRADATTPNFLAEADELARHARGLCADDLQRLMRISEPLARLNAGRFAAFSAKPGAARAKPAALLFDGDTYAGLEATSMSGDAWRWAQRHLRILSGLYGLLRPLDLIEPYRLEMGSRLKTARGASLYDFWGDRLALALNAAAQEADTGIVVNCASQEYFRAGAPGVLALRVVTPVFLEEHASGPRIVSFHAKKARGAMARYIMENRLTDPADLRDFDAGGYRFDSTRSEADRAVFLRAEALTPAS